MADDGFAAVLARVAGDEWTLPTPCAAWNVRQLVGHVVCGSAMATAIARGADRNAAIAALGRDLLGDDPVTAYREVLDEQADALDDPAVLGRRCAHPAGDVTGAQLIAFRTSDLLVHTWDLATAIDVPVSLDPDLVDEVWRSLQPMRAFIGRTGVYGPGPSGSLADDAPLEDRLLDLTGRRPLSAAAA
jgi:uncharacterized protein (TIGR03086 family)